jgi:hypothetical protein
MLVGAVFGFVGSTYLEAIDDFAFRYLPHDDIPDNIVNQNGNSSGSKSTNGTSASSRPIITATNKLD